MARGIAATVYYGALLESCRLAKASGRPYETFAGSPLESGKLQPDLWVEEGTLAANWELEVEAATGGYLTPRKRRHQRLGNAQLQKIAQDLRAKHTFNVRIDETTFRVELSTQCRELIKERVLPAQRFGTLKV
ncbi:MAG: hypothetical protein EBY92_08560 [Actinobacteria bacterium]|nr:hypothetical protein [Actinomycetota bacterium]